MRCPECIKEDKRSRVYIGGSTTTLMSTNSFYDENGDGHLHDPNTTLTEYRCNRGHHWTENEKYICWCGFGKQNGVMK